MVYTTTDIEKVLGYKSWSVIKKQDELLRMDCRMYCHIGIDSSKAEKSAVRIASRKIYLAIKTINHPMGELFLTTMDKRKKEKEK
jgi:hypothetical protein